MPSGSIHPKAAPAGRFATTLLAYNGTPAQPQFTQWGQLGEILGGVEVPERGARRGLAVRLTAWGSSDEYKRADFRNDARESSRNRGGSCWFYENKSSNDIWHQALHANFYTARFFCFPFPANQ